MARVGRRSCDNGERVGWSIVGLLLLATGAVFGQSRSPRDEADRFAGGRVLEGPGQVIELRDRPAVLNATLAERFDSLLPTLMRETGIEMWLVVNREYAEDPVYFTLAPAPSFAARRTTMLVFFDRGEDAGVERLTVNRYPLGDLYEPAWEGGDLEEQWSRLGEIVRERDPETIGINVSRHWPVADGLTAGLRDRLVQAVGPELGARFVSAENLVVRWLETRSESELQRYPSIVGLARGVIAEAFSARAITPGVTTPDDVAWFIRRRFAELDLRVWFHPDVNVQRPAHECDPESPFCGTADTIIRRGDVLHTDVGICYLGLCTDTQEMGYVMMPGETRPPEGLVTALAIGNRWQDLLTAEFAAGRTGNEILEAAREAAMTAGIRSSVYTHPLGVFGHAPGPTIGMWDNQGATPIRGDWPLYPDTAYAIEGNVMVQVPEWDDHWVQIKLEQSALFAGGRVTYLAGRQTEWHLVH